MKLASVLTTVNQVEKAKFINCLDKLCAEISITDKNLASKIQELDGQLKSASSLEITQLFEIIREHYKSFVISQLELLGGDVALLVRLLSRDGNSFAKSHWIEQLFNKDLHNINQRSNELQAMLQSNIDESQLSDSRACDIYFSCLQEALYNDKKSNRECRITDDERSILNVLGDKLNISTMDRVALEHSISAISATNIEGAIEQLRELGLLFFRRKDRTIIVPDEIVLLLNEMQKKQLADKHLVRILRTLSDAELSNILKAHNMKTRGIERVEKIRTIIHMGLNIEQLLSIDMHATDRNSLEIKERLKELINDLDLDLERIGSTAEDRINLIFDNLRNCDKREFNTLSASGFKEMLTDLKQHFAQLDGLIRAEFEIDTSEEIDVERLILLSITPFDVLFVLNNNQIKEISKSMGIKRSGNLRNNIVATFANVTDQYIESYDLLARRDIEGLKNQGLVIAEAEIGVKFEEVTKSIFEQLGLDVDEDLRKNLNTSKDKADIILSISGDDVIICETKTFKEGLFSKYSSTSRQVKAYVNKCENSGKRVVQALIVAPKFSEDFIEASQMDTEVNISLLEAEGLKMILDAYKAKRNPIFSYKLLTKGGLLKHRLIAKKI